MVAPGEYGLPSENGLSIQYEVPSSQAKLYPTCPEIAAGGSLPQQTVAIVEEMKRGAMEKAMRAMLECIFGSDKWSREKFDEL